MRRHKPAGRKNRAIRDRIPSGKRGDFFMRAAFAGGTGGVRLIDKKRQYKIK
jgi:hypothetical protein